MPLFGAHLSVAGGLHNAVAAAVALGCDAVQIFTKNANQWVGKATSDDDVTAFRTAYAASGLRCATAHDSYLINLAAPDDALFHKSVAAFADEIERAERLGLDYLVTHPGAHTGSGEAAGLARVVTGLDEALARHPRGRVKVLLETTAGQGTTLGHRFEHLAALLHGVREPERIGVCFDTCHAFAAGYALHTADGYAETFDTFDRLIGLPKLLAFHVNDSLKPFGSRVDRHAHLGRGHIGADAFRRLATDGRFADRPMLLETPKEDDEGAAMDPVNLALLRGFVTAAIPAAPAQAAPRRGRSKMHKSRTPNR